MARKLPANHGRPWTKKDERKLEQLAHKNTPTRLIARELERTEGAVYSKASEENVSLKPTNQPPYNRGKG